MATRRRWFVPFLVAIAALLVAACAPPAEPAPPAPPVEKPPVQPAEKPPAPPVEKPPVQPVEKPVAQPELPTGAPPIDPQAQRGGELIFATSKDLVSNNPFQRTQSVGQYIKETFWESLLSIDVDGQLHPLLAESWEVSDDLTEFTFNLQRGVQFHDGQEMTADDVIWSIEYVRNPENAAIGHARLAPVTQVDRVDDYTVRLVTNEPSPSLLNFLAEIRALPILPEGSMQIGQIEDLPVPPVGTGAFRFVEYVPNVRTVVERFDDYWGGAPYLDRIVFQLVPDDTVRFTALRAGDVHVAERIPFEFLPRIEAGEIPGIEIYNVPDSGMRRVQFNQTAPIFENNHLLRQAITYAIDRDAVLEEAWGGFATPTDGRIPSGSALRDVQPQYEYNPDRARELAQQAGYAGEEISLISRRGHENVGESVHRMLQEAGFNVRAEVMESAIVVERENSARYELLTGGGSLDYDPLVAYRSTYYCEGDDRYTHRIDNDIGYCNDEVDRLLDAMSETIDFDERLELYRQFKEITQNDVTNYYLGTEPRYFASRAGVENFVPSGDGGYLSYPGGGLLRTWLSQ